MQDYGGVGCFIRKLPSFSLTEAEADSLALCGSIKDLTMCTLQDIVDFTELSHDRLAPSPPPALLPFVSSPAPLQPRRGESTSPSNWHPPNPHHPHCLPNHPYSAQRVFPLFCTAAIESYNSINGDASTLHNGLLLSGSE